MRVGNEWSPVISTTPGVRQGCVLAPELFCRAVDWLMSRLKSGGNLEIRMRPNTFDDLDYADDGDMLPPDITLTGALLEKFDEETSHLSLHVVMGEDQNAKRGLWRFCQFTSCTLCSSQHSGLCERIHLSWQKITTDGNSAPDNIYAV